MANEDLVADYLGEAHDYLDQLNRVLLVLAESKEEWPKETVNDLFRSAHSLKGLSACFGFERTNAVTHQLESLLTLVRDGRVATSTEVVRAMFDAIDLIQHLTVEVATGGKEVAPIEIVVENMVRVASRKPEDHPAEPAQAGAPTAAGGAKGATNGGAAPSPNADANETVRVRMERLDRMVNLTGELVVARSRFQLVSRQLRSMQRLTELAVTVQEMGRRLDELESLQNRTPNLPEAMSEVVDALQAHSARLQAAHGDLVGTGRLLRDLDEVAYDFDGVVGGIHEAVLQLRMVPLDTVFRRLQRVVRDTAETLHKAVDFEVAGGETQIDKRVADELVNPLVHMLRNSVDHGLESTEVRRQAGKPLRGKVRVTSYQRGSSVVIEVRDDGGGIDPSRVLKKAVEMGLVSPEEAAAMPPNVAQRLIFAPGFSTAQKVTEVSGRGMGMDIIAAAIKALRGSLDLTSEVGVGTCFTVQLPPSMSILSSLLIEVNGTMFALPLTEVREIVGLKPGSVHTVQTRRMVVVRDRPMPLVMLPQTYRFPGTPRNGAVAGSSASTSPLHAIVFGFDGNEVALGVDRLVGKEDLVIKPLCAELATVQGLAGMAIRGDGKVTLILDPSGFAAIALSRHAASPQP